MFLLIFIIYHIKYKTFSLFKSVFGSYFLSNRTKFFYRFTYIEEYCRIMQLFKSITTNIHCQYNKGLERGHNTIISNVIRCS